MQHFFADPSCVDGEQIRLAGSDVNHMKNVLRMKPGEEVWISDGEGTDYFCKVEGYEEKEAVLRVVKKEVSQTELASRLILFQGLPKGEKMECAEGSRAWSLLYCSVCGKAFGCKAGSEESRKEERTLAGDRQGGCGTVEERNCATSAECDELSGSNELRERAGCSACSIRTAGRDESNRSCHK